MAEEEALGFYKEAMNSLKSSDDYHWMMGVEVGRAAGCLLRWEEGREGSEGGSGEELGEYIIALN